MSIYILLGGPSAPNHEFAPHVALALFPQSCYLQSPFKRMLSYEYNTKDIFTVAENEAFVLLSTFL